MTVKGPNPAFYDTHFPNFRNVEWNPDPVDIGARIEGLILQSIARNALFDRINGLWRFQSGDSTGRSLTSQGAANGKVTKASSFSIGAGTTQVLAANPTRGGIYLENRGLEPITLGFTDSSGSLQSVTIPNDYAMNVPSYTGALIASATPTSITDSLFVFEYN